MKKVILILAACLGMAVSSYAQKIGYINMETIMNAIPEYVSAQSELEKIAEGYNKEIEEGYKVIETMYDAYQREQASLSTSVREQRKNEIILAERELKEKQNSYFGQEGVMAQEYKQRVEPITKNIKAVIDAFAAENGYSLILDLATLNGVVYSNEKEDLSQKIISRL